MELICNEVSKGSIMDFEHIGSTAVPGIKAKPSIDVLMVISSNTDLDELKSVIASLGYHCIPQPEKPAPYFMFAKGYTPQGFKGQAFHVHVRYPGNWDEVNFRDYLIQHPEKAKQYEELKMELAKKHKYDRDAYTNAKTDFIKNVQKDNVTNRQIKIRKAVLADSNEIADFLLLAMEDIIYEFIGVSDFNKAKILMQYFVGKPNNQYSYENCWVVIDNKRIVAAVNIYKGADLAKLRAPVLDYIEKQYMRKFIPEDETQAGEYYIDTIGVSPECQGTGIGSSLLKFIIDEYVNKQSETLGLLVDNENPQAKKLYLKLGFKPVGYKKLVGKTMDHLQIAPGIK